MLNFLKLSLLIEEAVFFMVAKARITLKGRLAKLNNLHIQPELQQKMH